MRRFIAEKTDSITAATILRIRGTVAGLATLGMRFLEDARSLMQRLAGRELACVYVGKRRMRRVGVTGAARPLGNHCLSGTWSRLSWRPAGDGAPEGQL